MPTLSAPFDDLNHGAADRVDDTPSPLTLPTLDPTAGVNATVAATASSGLNPKANEPHAKSIASWDVARLRDLADAYADATYLDNEADLTLPTSSPLWRAVTTHRTRAAHRLADAAAEIFAWKLGVPRHGRGA